MFRRLFILTTSYLLWIFLLEIVFVNYLTDSSEQINTRSTFFTTTGDYSLPFPSGRRKTAPEIRKYAQGPLKKISTISSVDSPCIALLPHALYQAFFYNPEMLDSKIRISFFDQRSRIAMFYMPLGSGFDDRDLSYIDFLI